MLLVDYDQSEVVVREEQSRACAKGYVASVCVFAVSYDLRGVAPGCHTLSGVEGKQSFAEMLIEPILELSTEGNLWNQVQDILAACQGFIRELDIDFCLS